MAASAVSICSNALLRLGAKPSSSFEEADQTDGLVRARLCSNLYPTVRDDVLRSHNWNCCKARVVLSPDSTPPAFGYSSRFLLPGDWLRTLGNGPEGSDEFEWEQEGRYILADTNALYLRYIFRNENAASWDAMLISVMELAMTAALAYPITKSTTKESSCKEAYLFAIKQARAVDGQEETPPTVGDFPFLSARSAGV